MQRSEECRKKCRKKCRVKEVQSERSAECRMKSAECRVQNAECRVQSAELKNKMCRGGFNIRPIPSLLLREKGDRFSGG